MRSLLGLIAAVGLVASVLPDPGSAQGRAGAITGRVTAEDTGQPLAGVSVSIIGTQLGGVSGQDGRFTITGIAPGTYQVLASLIGYGQQSIPRVSIQAGSGAVVDMKLSPKAISLAEVVVVGYGQSRRREDITSAVASIASDQFIAGPARDAAQMVAGKLPGLSIITPSGNPTGASEISIRGRATMNGSTQPLVLIDGVPATSASQGLQTVAPEDIESITVLKDGSAGAVYGSRASNGVILVQTKRHTGGQATFRYTGYVSASSIYNRPDFLTAADFRELEGKPGVNAFITDLDPAGQVETDWMGVLLRQPVSYRHNLSISGGSATTNYTASIDYEDTQGIFIRSDNRETTGRVNIGHSMFDGRLTANLNLVTGVRQNIQGLGYNYAWRQALIRNPTDRVFEENGAYREPTGYFYENPLRLLQENNGEREGRSTRMHGTITLSPIDNLRFSLLAGTTRSSTLIGTAATFNTVAGTNASAFRSDSSGVDRLIQLTGNYTKSFLAHSVSVEGGYDYQDFWVEGFSAGNAEFPSDQYQWHLLGAGDALRDNSGRASIGSIWGEDKVIGFFGRMNYDWNNRYLLSASLRREGNSRFGANHKWGWFPAISGGWRVSEESFMDRFPSINELKLRVGYGVTGIAPNNRFGSLASYSYGARFPYNGDWIQSLAPSRNANPNLRWERKGEINLGLDFGVLSNRLYGSLDIYERNTHDMLANYNVPSPPNPVGSILANVGRMRNRGVEGILSWDVLRSSGLSWTTSINGSTNKNLVLSLSDSAAGYITASCRFDGGTGEPIQQSTHRTCVGEPIGNFYGFKSVDLDDKGEWIVVDSDGRLISIDSVNNSDRHVLGNGVPKYQLAWNNQARYKNFDLSVNMRGSFGYQILNFQRLFYENPTIAYNLLKTAFDAPYGKKDAQGKPILLTHPQAYVSYYIEDGDHWKIDNATLGYTVPRSALGLLGNTVSSARFYLSGRNLLTLTGYKGMDPEVSTNNFDPGNDARDQYPTIRTFTFGVNVSF
jgi:TonB-dependent starch-binding outer membrane protein SusC